MDPNTQQGNDGPIPAPSEDMLLGRMRDLVLDTLRPIIGWPKLKEAQQHKINNGVEQACRQVIREAAPIIAGRGFDTISATVGDLNVKGENVVAKLTAERTRENILGPAEAGRATLVLVNPEIYMGAKPAPVMKDQPDLMDGAPAPESEAAQQARLLEGFKPTADATTAGAEATKVLGDLLPPKVKAAAARGHAHRQSGGDRKLPADLDGKADLGAAWFKGYDAADGESGAPTGEAAQASGRTIDEVTGEVYLDGAKPPPRKRGRQKQETADA